MSNNKNILFYKFVKNEPKKMIISDLYYNYTVKS